jgi:secreted trypsin-like serine protease
MAVKQTNASCLPNTSQTNTFRQYITQCRTASDTARATNFFSNSIQSYKDTFQSLRAQFDDLIVLGNSVNTLTNATGQTATGVDTQITEHQKKKDKLLADIQSLRRQSEASDKSFLEDVMHGTPQEEIAPSLQDAVLLLFWFGWAIMALTLVGIRWMSPGGTYKAGLFTFAVLFLITVCIYAILQKVA